MFSLRLKNYLTKCNMMHNYGMTCCGILEEPWNYQSVSIRSSIGNSTMENQYLWERVNPNYNGSCNMILTSYQRLNTTGNLHFRLGGHYNSVFARDILKEVPDFFFSLTKTFLKMWSLTNSQKHQKGVKPITFKCCLL